MGVYANLRVYNVEEAGVFVLMSSKLPKGMLLDLDDTILAFDAVADLSWQQTLNQFIHAGHQTDIQTVHATIKQSARNYWSDAHRHRVGRLNVVAARTQIVRDALKSLQIYDVQLATNIVNTYGVVRTELIEPIPGAIETIQELNDRNIPMILVTNGDAAGQRRKIERFQLGRFFKSILIEGECGFGKPDARVYQRALSELDLAPEDVWMVGDNLEWEVIVPQQFGIKGIWVDYRGVGLPEGCVTTPYRIVSTLKDILS